MKQLCLLLALVCFAATFAGDVPWLDDVTTPPADVPEPAKPLVPLLVDDNGRPITSIDGWKARRKELREAWLEFLGPLPQAPSGGITLKTVSEETLDHCTRTLVRYEVEPGRVVEAFLLRPNGSTEEKRPAVVVFHPTNVETIHVVAGTGGRPDQHLGLRLAERGFVVFCPANFLWEEKDYKQAVAAARKRHPDSLGMATMLADGMRAVDILSTLPGVDSDRIGAIGHSLGAKEVLYLTAFDERVKVGVSSEGGVALDSTNWDDPWYLGDAINRPAFARNHHELLALAAPRSLLILGGESGRGASDGDRSWPYLVAAQKVYRLYDEPVRLGLLNHREGHKLSPANAEKAFEWLEAGL
ncbi:MAG: dienelactone hydrolase family protein [Planctomycetaceae bacterium]